MQNELTGRNIIFHTMQAYAMFNRHPDSYEWSSKFSESFESMYPKVGYICRVNLFAIWAILNSFEKC